MEKVDDQDPRESAEALLSAFLSSGDSAGTAPYLEKLISEHAEPVIRKITRYKFCSAGGHGYLPQDEEDARGTAVLQLISRLHKLRTSPGAPIMSFSAYVAGIAYNSCNKLLRTKYPARWKLKNRLRYLLNHRPGFAVWESARGEWLCGLAGWNNRISTQDFRAEEADAGAAWSDFLSCLPSGVSLSQMKPEELVRALLSWRGLPMPLEELVKMVAHAWNIQDLPATGWTPAGEGANICDLLPDPSMDVASRLEQRSFLERLWQEIQQLPPRQRAALLLNLRDAQERDALILFVLTGLANLRQLATVLEIPLPEFARIWNHLPLDDMAIAETLGLSRQQVINLRKSARERLARRMGHGRQKAKKPGAEVIYMHYRTPSL